MQCVSRDIKKGHFDAKKRAKLIPDPPFIRLLLIILLLLLSLHIRMAPAQITAQSHLTTRLDGALLSLRVLLYRHTRPWTLLGYSLGARSALPPPNIFRSSRAPTTPARLKALIQLFDFLLYHSAFRPGDALIIYTDSQYALSLLLGSSLPSTHHQLVVLAQ